MSVPLDAIAIHDTHERIARARLMQDYLRVAREELEHISLFKAGCAPATPPSTHAERTVAQEDDEVAGEIGRVTPAPASHEDGSAILPATPSPARGRGGEKLVGEVWTKVWTTVTAPPATPKVGGYVWTTHSVSTSTSTSTATATFKPPSSSSPTPTPRKKSAKLKKMFTLKKKPSTTDSFTDIRRAMGSECLEVADASLARPRTADPREGGQLPGEDSWEWYTRNICALPPMPGQAAFAAQRAEMRM